jgi:hypothetical protein
MFPLLTHIPYRGEKMNMPTLTEQELRSILSDPRSKDYKDLRDRAAYVYITGSFPTHLRTLMTSLLRAVTKYSRTPVSLDGSRGSIKLDNEMVDALGLDEHPMIRKVKHYIDQGYRLQPSPFSLKDRRPFSRVYLTKDNDKVIVQADGSVRDGW